MGKAKVGVLVVFMGAATVFTFNIYWLHSNKLYHWGGLVMLSDKKRD